MDADRFDTLARSLSAAGSRRRALAFTLSGGFGLLGLARPEDVSAARSGKCKPKCGACERCKRGDCKKKNGKKRCTKGKCKPRKDFVDCPLGQVRNPETCGCCQLAEETCPISGPNGCCSGSCPGGTCESKSAGELCTFGAQCGTGVCSGGVCACSAVSEPCSNNVDCCDATSGNQVCHEARCCRTGQTDCTDVCTADSPCLACCGGRCFADGLC